MQQVLHIIGQLEKQIQNPPANFVKTSGKGKATLQLVLGSW